MRNPLDRFFDWLETTPLKPFVQFLRFGFVGVLNTQIQYGIEQLCYYVIFRDVSFDGIGLALGVTGETVRVFVVTAIGFVISVTHAYFWNSLFVFREGLSLRRYARTVASYALTGLVVSPLIKRAAQGLGFPFWAASLLSLLITVPLNFVLNKFWAFRKGKAAETGETP